MDRIIGEYPWLSFGDDLCYCGIQEVIYQRDTSNPVSYDEAYFNNYVAREDTPVAIELNKVRTELATKYCKTLLDIGIGSGEFIEKTRNAKVYGYDINPVGEKWLKECDLWINPWEHNPEEIEGFTCWDVIEHMAEPTAFLDLLRVGQYLFVSLPIFTDLKKVRESKHFKPGEHLLYFTRQGFINYAQEAGFKLLEDNDNEVKAGRSDVHSFAFLKVHL